MIIDLTLVIRDGSVPASGEPLEPEVRNIRWPEGESGKIRFVLKSSARLATPIGLATLTLTVLRRRGDTAPVFTVNHTVPDGAGTGVGEFVITSAMTAEEGWGVCRFDVQHVLAGERTQVLPVSDWSIGEVAGKAPIVP
jgi:hypothetical protein